MHMADALLSPPVGGIMWAATAAMVTYSSVQIKKEMDTKKIPLMGVMGAFIFAAQMINFAIPGTGSSGHIGGGMILAILLGPYAGFLTIASVLITQALFFADGGLLALGCNIFNMGIIPCFIVYPLIYKTIKNEKPYSPRSIIAVMLSVVVGLQLGAVSVVLETLFSGITALSIGKFLFLMLPIHLAIGAIEGVITIMVINFIWKARPDILETTQSVSAKEKKPLKNLIVGLSIAALITGGMVSWFASSDPDGLEWSLFHTTGKEELENPDSPAYNMSEEIQEKTALLPDYDFKSKDNNPGEQGWPAVNAGTTFSGIIGSVITLLIIVLFSFILHFIRKKKFEKNSTR
ncbi:MAG: energy-coupling factor ABC transporter permease [Spirochaetales bacterium]|nr:energy-coupling factor ABC transporter permease [Spirochaetales bacterium]